MSHHPTDRFLFCDLETFGLDYDEDPILEMGFAIYDVNLSVVPIATFSSILWRPEYGARREDKRETDSFVEAMHTKSGLWADIKAGPESGEKDLWHPLAVEERAIAWLENHDIGRDDPLVGSSIQFDRNMLAHQHPAIEKIFSYRNIDISSLKEVCRRINPALFEKLPKSREAHRVLDDCDDSREELKWYVDNFLYMDMDI